jgi:hypothetical protein
MKAQVSFGLKKKAQAMPKEVVVAKKAREHPYEGYEYEEVVAVGPNEYPIDAEDSLDFYIAYSCDVPLPMGQINYKVRMANSSPIAIGINASFEGTKIRILEPDLSFGIVKSFSTCSKSFEVENYSLVDAEILIRCKKHKQLDLDSIKEV